MKKRIKRVTKPSFDFSVVKSLIGKVPDNYISDMCGCSRSTVTYYRQRNKIDSYRKLCSEVFC